MAPNPKYRQPMLKLFSLFTVSVPVLVRLWKVYLKWQKALNRLGSSKKGPVHSMELYNRHNLFIFLFDNSHCCKEMYGPDMPRPDHHLQTPWETLSKR